MRRKSEHKYIYDLVEELNKYIHLSPFKNLKPIVKRIKYVNSTAYGRYNLMHPVNPPLIKIYTYKYVQKNPLKLIYVLTIEHLETLIKELKVLDEKISNYSKEIQKLIDKIKIEEKQGGVNNE